MLIISIFLTSGGRSEARPTDNAVDLLKVPEDPDTDIRDRPVFQLQSFDDNNKEEWLEAMVEPIPDVEGSGILTENSNSLEGDANSATLPPRNASNDRNESDVRKASNARNARNASNACIERYIYRIIYNYFFRIPVCKAGCKPKYKSVNFSNGQTYAILYDCYK